MVVSVQKKIFAIIVFKQQFFIVRSIVNMIEFVFNKIIFKFHSHFEVKMTSIPLTRKGKTALNRLFFQSAP